MSDEDGNFGIGSLPPGAYTLRAYGSGVGPIALGPRPGDVRIELALAEQRTGVTVCFDEEPEFEVAGKVMDSAEAPVWGTQVSVSGRTGERRVPVLGCDTGEDGSFRALGLPAGEFDIEVSHSGFAASHLERVPAGTGDLVVTLRRSGAIEGRVVDRLSGEPVQHFALTVDPNAGRSDAPAPTARRYRAGGRFRLDVITPGLRTLTIRAMGYRDSIVTDIEVPEAAAAPPIEIRLDRTP